MRAGRVLRDHSLGPTNEPDSLDTYLMSHMQWVREPSILSYQTSSLLIHPNYKTTEFLLCRNTILSSPHQKSRQERRLLD